MTGGRAASGLLSDDPAAIDLLSFDAVAHTVVDALLDTRLDPVALGLSGRWGSGKTTVLNLVADELPRRVAAPQKVLVLRTDPWRYDPATGAKESLISEVLGVLGAELADHKTLAGKAKDLLARLNRRIDWAKALKLAATSSLTLQIPSFDSLFELVKPGEGGAASERGLEAFREEFAQLMSSEELSHVTTMVVLVDDLDRCLPPTVVETLEAMRLFLAVPKMSFVIAADEERVADAIRTRFASTGAAEPGTEDRQDPATLYLHKIVQTTVPLPALSHFDTQAYLLLLQLHATAATTAFEELVARCSQVRREGGTIDTIGEINDLQFADELAFATRLTPLLYEKLQGNPRYIKRFLNDLHVRQAVARRRGINLDPGVVAKLMALEALMKIEFRQLLGWFAKGEMRLQLEALEQAAGRQYPAPAPAPTAQAAAGAAAASGQPVPAGQFSQALLRWATLAPPLQGLDLAPYLTLAASYAGISLIDDSLPERLRDIAANLLSESGRHQVPDPELTVIGEGEAADLLRHLGRSMRDRPERQKTAVNAILRIARLRPGAAQVAGEALRMLPPSDLTFATPVQFQSTDPAPIRAALTYWQQSGAVTTGPVRRSLEGALRQPGQGGGV
ncbi:NTPase [Streptomyces sp. SID13666]|uniref:P-loop NTPase fold protein n=1 Tax=unclassified Streptomyces TaxID=2593676 RepID=UPI0013BF2CD9|nr:NTPase [Streptomyces sp. SID13666]NEA76767.1 NTPase [Streptomyces sp. SID13588]